MVPQDIQQTPSNPWRISARGAKAAVLTALKAYKPELLVSRQQGNCLAFAICEVMQLGTTGAGVELHGHDGACHISVYAINVDMSNPGV